MERVRRPAQNSAEQAMNMQRQSMDFVTTAMRFEECSAYAMEVGCRGACTCVDG